MVSSRHGLHEACQAGALALSTQESQPPGSAASQRDCKPASWDHQATPARVQALVAVLHTTHSASSEKACGPIGQHTPSSPALTLTCLWEGHALQAHAVQHNDRTSSCTTIHAGAGRSPCMANSSRHPPHDTASTQPTCCQPPSAAPRPAQMLQQHNSRQLPTNTLILCCTHRQPTQHAQGTETAGWAQSVAPSNLVQPIK